MGQQWGIAESLEGLAQVALAQEQPERAAHLLGAAEVIRERWAARWQHPASDRSEQNGCPLKTVFAAAWAEGRAVPVEQAVAYAMRCVDASTGPAA